MLNELEFEELKNQNKKFIEESKGWKNYYLLGLLSLGYEDHENLVFDKDTTNVSFMVGDDVVFTVDLKDTLKDNYADNTNLVLVEKLINDLGKEANMPLEAMFEEIDIQVGD